jgi:hypothetical protein
MEYKVVGNTAAGDPGNGSMRFNTAAQTDATQLYFDQLGVGNVDQSAILSGLLPGDVLDFQQKDDANVVGSYTVNSVTDNVGWFTIDVTPGESFGAWPMPGNKGVIITVNSETVTQPPAQAYEYEMQSFPIGTLNDKKAWLNQMGSEGWQLIQFGGLSADGTLLAVFIRPV